METGFIHARPENARQNQVQAAPPGTPFHPRVCQSPRLPIAAFANRSILRLAAFAPLAGRTSALRAPANADKDLFGLAAAEVRQLVTRGISWSRLAATEGTARNASTGSTDEKTSRVASARGQGAGFQGAYWGIARRPQKQEPG